MRWVPQAAISPHKCAVIPFIGTSNAKAGFFDAEVDLPGWDPHVYISVEAVEMMAKEIGWEPASTRGVAEKRLVERDERIAALEHQLEEAAKYQESVEYTLGKFGAKVQRKPGRKVAA